MNSPNRTYHLVTLGCAKNEIDSEALECDLQSAGLVSVDDSRDADLIIVNSCGFINDAKVETIQTILDLHQDRKQGSLLVLAGCLPARYNLSRSLDEVDIFLPSKKHSELIPRLKELGWNIGHPDSSQKRLLPLAPFGYLRISEGCDNRCAYCAIPDIKGPFTSRPLDEILNEANFLCSNGVKELVLIGQDTTLYGQNGGHEKGLPFLLEKLAEIKSCEWIRLMYAHPAHLSDETIEVMASNGKVVKYLDLPLQHINSRLLKLMNRKVSREQIVGLIDKLRLKLPQIALRTTFIVGFPGETDDEFGELLDFIEEIQFDNIGAFKYSPEEGTPAYKLKGRVDEDLIEERYLTLLDIQNMISFGKLKKHMGAKQRVLLHEIDSDGVGQARAWFQAPEVDGQVLIENCSAEPGGFIETEIINAEAYDLFAKQMEGR
jgi:ribosomal protein S12 methylthiotransferase